MFGLLERIQVTPVSIFLLFGCGLLMLYYQSCYNDGASIDARIAAVSQEIAKSSEELDAASKVAAEKAKFQEEVNSVSDQLRAAYRYLPATLDVQDVIRRISNEARFAGVGLSRIKPLKPEPKGFYEELSMDIEVEGTYSQITLFLSAISKIDRIVNIRNLELNKSSRESDSQTLLRVKGELAAYRYFEEKKKDASPTEEKK